jgi:hypothetical protein
MLVESAGLSVAMLDPFSLVVVSPGLVCACARLHCNLASVVAFEDRFARTISRNKLRTGELYSHLFG